LLVGLCPDSLDALAESWWKGGERGEGRAGGERKWREKRGRGEGEDGKEVGSVCSFVQLCILSRKNIAK